MEEQIGKLQRRLEERNEQLQVSTSTTEKVFLFLICFFFLVLAFEIRA